MKSINDLNRIEPELLESIQQHVADAVATGWFVLGKHVTSRVATVANAGFYSSAAILACGANPCYIDVEIEDSTMSIAHLKESLSRQELDAVIVTHLYGRLARIEEVRQVCDKHQIPLIEDCAQAHGASLAGRKAGSFGDLSCFSFYPTKNLGAMGDGGAICTSDNALQVPELSGSPGDFDGDGL